jgi:predicted amidohydrolase
MQHRVAVVQTEPGWQLDGASLTQRIVELVRPAVEGGAELVALSALLGWATAGPRLGQSADAPYGLEALHGVDLSSLEAIRALQQASEEAASAYREAARILGVWLVGGSMPQVGEGDRLYNAAPVVSPEGEIKGWQQQAHLSLAERAWGLCRGEELSVIETPVGRLGLLLREDVLYPEVGRFLCLLGTNVLVHQGSWRRAGQVLIHNNYGENQNLSTSQAEWMSRLWREVQANQVFGLESVLAGGWYRGRATIHAPLEMTLERNGILAQARGDIAEEVIVAELDLQALQAVINHYPIYEMLNEGMYRRYFPSLYERARE